MLSNALGVVAGALLTMTGAGWQPPSILAVGAGGSLVASVVAGRAARARWLGVDERPDALLGRELDRSRRYNHPFTLIRVPANGTSASAARRLRTGDAVWRDGDDVVVLLSETDDAGARAFAERLPRPQGSPLCRATFPDDALTAGALLALIAKGPHR